MPLTQAEFEALLADASKTIKGESSGGKTRTTRLPWSSAPRSKAPRDTPFSSAGATMPSSER